MDTTTPGSFAIVPTVRRPAIRAAAAFLFLTLAGAIEPIRSRTGYRRNVVLIDRQVVALRDASGRRVEELAPTLRYRGLARYLFIRCDEEFVFVPAALVGTRGCDRLLDRRFRNSFAVFADGPEQGSAGQPAGGPGLPIR